MPILFLTNSSHKNVLQKKNQFYWMEYRSVRQLHEEFNQQNDNEKKKKSRRWTSLNSPWNASMNRIACIYSCCSMRCLEMDDEVMIVMIDVWFMWQKNFKSMTTHLAVLIIKIFADMNTKHRHWIIAYSLKDPVLMRI